MVSLTYKYYAMFIFLGFYINSGNVPKGAGWIQEISFIRWGFQSLVINEFTGLTLTCDDIRPGEPCVRTGEEVLARLSFQDGSVFTGCMALLGKSIPYR